MDEKDKIYCLIEECQNHAEKCGLCDTCYDLAEDLVMGGETSWPELQALGMVDNPIIQE